MKTIAGIVVLCMTVCLSLVQTAAAQELVIVDDRGESTYRIVVAVDASIQDHYAAQQLQRYVEEMSGVNLPIVGDDSALIETEILVGFNRHVDQLGLNLAKDSFGPEEFLIKTAGQTLVIIGGSPRGVLYGVNSLLTDEWGCRWFTPLLKRIPKRERLRERLTVPPTERRYQPPFEWRHANFASVLDNEWAFHNFQNPNFASLRPEQGGRAGYVHNMFCHTELSLVPPERYREAHPEYFWAGIGDETRVGGRHKSEALGICLTNPEVARIAAESILTFRDQRLDESDLLFSVSAEDGRDSWCEGPGCMDFYNRHGGLKPHRSGALGTYWLHFAGRVDRILQEQGEEFVVRYSAHFRPGFSQDQRGIR